MTSNDLAVALGLVRHARTVSHDMDDFALAALIDAEVDLEDLTHPAELIPHPDPNLTAVDSIHQALALLTTVPAARAAGWLRSTLDGDAS